MRAIVIEQWGILRHGITAVLNDAGGDAVASVATATEGLAVLRGRPVELVVTGVTADLTTEAVVERVKAISVTTCVLCLVQRPDRGQLEELLAAGAEGVLVRRADEAELRDALVRLARGEHVLSPQLISMLVRREEPVAVNTGGLTRREMEILTRLCGGASNREIAAALVISDATVKSHLASIYAKLGVASRHQAVARALELGLISWAMA